MEDKEFIGYPIGYYRQCQSGCPRTENMKTELVGEARRERYGGPRGYWGI